MDSDAGIRAAAEQMLADLYAGRLHPKRATSSAALMNIILRARGREDLEHKISQLEARLDELSNAVNGAADEQDQRGQDCEG
jgi:hypothetical protein